MLHMVGSLNMITSHEAENCVGKPLLISKTLVTDTSRTRFSLKFLIESKLQVSKHQLGQQGEAYKPKHFANNLGDCELFKNEMRETGPSSGRPNYYHTGKSLDHGRPAGRPDGSTVSDRQVVNDAFLIGESDTPGACLQI